MMIAVRSSAGSASQANSSTSFTKRIQYSRRAPHPSNPIQRLICAPNPEQIFRHVLSFRKAVSDHNEHIAWLLLRTVAWELKLIQQTERRPLALKAFFGNHQYGPAQVCHRLPYNLKVGVKRLLKCIGGLVINPARSAKFDNRTVAIFNQVWGAARHYISESVLKQCRIIAKN